MATSGNNDRKSRGESAKSKEGDSTCIAMLDRCTRSREGHLGNNTLKYFSTDDEEETMQVNSSALVGDEEVANTLLRSPWQNMWRDQNYLAESRRHDRLTWIFAQQSHAQAGKFAHSEHMKTTMATRVRLKSRSNAERNDISCSIGTFPSLQQAVQIPAVGA